MKNSIVINKTSIALSDDNTMLVPIKPICAALEIDYSSQIRNIKEHPTFSSTMVEMTTVGGDEKQREMLHLPIKYVLGWLMGIDARKVKPEAAEKLLAYQNEAYNVLYERFYLEPQLQKEKLISILEKEKAIMEMKSQRKEITQQIKALESELEEIKDRDAAQTSMNF